MSKAVASAGLSLDRAEEDALLLILASAREVAAATDPMLASILENVLSGTGRSFYRSQWRGDRRQGLELCRRLLEYVRHDISDKQLDVGLSYIASQLDGEATESKAPTAH